MALQNVTFPPKRIVKIHFIINCVLVFITLLVVGLRVLARVTSSAGLGWDDYLILIAVPPAIGMLVIQGLYVPMGVGYPLTEALPNIVVILKLMLSYALTYTFCIGLIKMSVLCFYIRVFVNKYVRIATICVGAFVLSWTTANVLLLFFICRPLRAAWDPTISTTHCGNQIKAFISIGCFNIISDIMICLLPLPTIWKLKTKRKMKLSLTFLFTISLLAVAVATGRIITLTNLELTNLTGTMVWVDFLSATETSLGVLCVSLPMLGPIINRFRKGNSSGYGSYPNPASKGSASKLSNKKRKPGADTIMLNSIDAGEEHDHDHMHYQNNMETSSQHGSEASLNPAHKQARIGVVNV